MVFPSGSVVKNPPAKQEILVQSLGWEDPLENEVATHPSILAWEIQWTEETCGVQSTGSQRVGHSLATKQQQQQYIINRKQQLLSLIIEKWLYLAHKKQSFMAM